MPFELAQIDEDALSSVDIRIDGDGESVKNIRLNSNNLMFPPVITKDSKSANWMEVKSGSYEPFKFYEQSQSRQLGIEFQWVTGGFKGDVFKPQKLHKLISDIKSYFYGAYFGGKKREYPAVLIYQLYNVVPPVSSQLTGTDYASAGGATFRMMNIDVKYSKELTRIDGFWYPLHIKLSINLESVSRLVSSESETPFSSFTNLMKRPAVEWF